MPEIAVLRRLRQEDCQEFKTIPAWASNELKTHQGYGVRHLKTKKKCHITLAFSLILVITVRITC